MSDNRVLEFDVIAIEVLHSSGEKTCAKSKETGAERSVEGVVVRHGGCKLPQRQTDSVLRKLLTDENESLIALVARDRGRKRWPYVVLGVFYGPD